MVPTNGVSLGGPNRWLSSTCCVRPERLVRQHDHVPVLVERGPQLATTSSMCGPSSSRTRSTPVTSAPMTPVSRAISTPWNRTGHSGEHRTNRAGPRRIVGSSGRSAAPRRRRCQGMTSATRRATALGAAPALGGLVWAVCVWEARVARRGPRPFEVALPANGPVGPLGPPVRATWLGDSLAAGLGVDHVADTPAHLVAQMLERSVDLTVLAVPGARAIDVIRDQLPRLRGDADLVVLSVGANDVASATSRCLWRRSSTTSSAPPPPSPPSS